MCWEIKRIDKNKFQDILVATNEEKTYLIPYVDAFINKIDLANREIIINDIKGLIE